MSLGNPRRSPWRAASLSGALAAVLLLAACQEEQILYRAESPTPIPPVPEQPEAAISDFADAHAERPAQPAFDLPAPEPTGFSAESPGETFRRVALEGVHARIPLRYRATPSPSDMRLVQYDVPAPEGEDLPAGEFIVFYFGEGQGGGVEENVMRWAGQFEPLDGAETPVSHLVQGEVDGLTVTRLGLEGRYVPGPVSPGAPGPAPQDGWAMEALVVEGAEYGNLYLRLTGPAELVRAESHVMEYIAASLERDADAHTTAQDHAHHDHDHDHDHSHAAPDAANGGVALVQAPGVAFAIPASWEPVPAESAMRALQFAVPGPGGEGELAVFYFGEDGGGSAQDNIDRWISQVSQPDGGDSASRARVEQRSVGRFAVSTVAVEGTYTATPPSPEAPAPEPREDYGLFGIVVEDGQEGSLFIRLTGPEETVRANREVMDALVASLQEPES